MATAKLPGMKKLSRRFFMLLLVGLSVTLAISSVGDAEETSRVRFGNGIILLKFDGHWSFRPYLSPSGAYVVATVYLCNNVDDQGHALTGFNCIQPERYFWDLRQIESAEGVLGQDFLILVVCSSEAASRKGNPMLI